MGKGRHETRMCLRYPRKARQWLKQMTAVHLQEAERQPYASYGGGRVGWTKLPTDRQSTTKLVADLHPLVCVACKHAVPCWCVTSGDQYAFGAHDPANRKEQKKHRRVIIRKHKIASSGVPVSVCLRATMLALPPSMRRLGAIPKCLCLLYTSPSPRDGLLSRMPSSA